MASTAREVVLPLSLVEEERLLLDARGPHLPFNTCLGLEVEGLLDLQVLERSIDALIQRHEILRTTFPPAPRNEAHTSGRFRRQIHSFAEINKLAIEDLSRLSRSEQIRKAEDLAKTAHDLRFDYTVAPLIRVSVLRFRPLYHWVIIVTPHLISDARSTQIIWNELSQLYASRSSGRVSPLAEAPQYVDFAAWQRRRFRGETLKREAAYWLNQWKRFAQSQATLDKLRLVSTDSRSFDCALEKFELSPQVSDQLRIFGQNRKATLFAVLLSGFCILISGWTGMPKIAVWSSFENRQRPEYANIVGWCALSHLLGVDLSDNPRCDEVIDRVRLTVINALSNQGIPSRLVTAIAHRLRPVTTGLIPAAHTYVSFDLTSDRATSLAATADVKFNRVSLPPGKRIPALAVTAEKVNHNIRISISYPKFRCDSVEILSFMDQFQVILERMLLMHDQRVSEVLRYTQSIRNICSEGG